MKKPLLYFLLIIFSITSIMTQGCNNEKKDTTKSLFIATYLEIGDVKEDRYWDLFLIRAEIEDNINGFLELNKMGFYVNSEDLESVYEIYSKEDQDKIMSRMKKVLKGFKVNNYNIQTRSYEDGQWKNIDHFAGK